MKIIMKQAFFAFILSIFFSTSVFSEKKSDKKIDLNVHYAVQIGSEEIVRDFLESGACVNKKDCFCQTPLHYAAKFGYAKIAKLLLERGAEKNVKDKFGETPEDLAKKNGRKEILDFLKKRKK